MIDKWSKFRVNSGSHLELITRWGFVNVRFDEDILLAMGRLVLEGPLMHNAHEVLLHPRLLQ